ncbi:MAG: GNAT family N-acetyltransferase [Eubacteriales bacterium]
MIRLEEKELEEQVLTSGCPIALPFEVNRTADGRLDLLVYSFCADLAREFEKNYSGDPFGDEARAFLYRNLAPLMRRFDYECAEAAERVHLEYHAPDGISAEGMCPCEILSSLDGETFGSLSLDDFTLDKEDPCSRLAVVRREGKIVCYAGLNYIAESDGFCEITVECEEACRRNGYAKSCVAHLAEYLQSCGENVKYVCAEENLASRRTACAAGFQLYKTCLPFVCYRVASADAEEGDRSEFLG